MFEARSPSAFINYIILVLIFIVCVFQTHEKSVLKSLQDTWNLIILCCMFCIFCVWLLRIKMLAEELFYIKSHYNGDFVSVLRATFNFNSASWIVMGITIFFFLMLVIHPSIDFRKIFVNNILATGCGFVFSFLLLYSINITDCHVRKAETIFTSGGLDPGTAMATSYFYGYLKIILPSSGGSERTGILSSLKDYESEQKVVVPVKKLFILIPASAYIPPDLKEISDDWLEPTGTPGIIRIDRAGVKRRPYHNTVYKLRPKGPMIAAKPFYLAIEGATPLKTFSEVQDKSHRYAPLYKEFNQEIIRNFYNTLKNLLNDNPDCRDYCELVYYEDIVDGKRINPAHVILERIAYYMGNSTTKDNF